MVGRWLNESSASGAESFVKVDELPVGWDRALLGEIASISLGRTPARDRKEYWSPPQVPWVSVADLNGGRVCATREKISTRAHEDIFGGQLVPPGRLLLSFKLTIGKIGVLDTPAVHNEAIANLTVDETKVDRDFLAHQLSVLDYTPYLDAYVKGKTLNKDKLKRLRLVLPSLDEQHAIASVLRDVQQAKEATDKVIIATRALKRSLMRYLFTYGSVPVTQTEDVPVKETEIGSIPKNWSLVSFKDILEEPLRNGLSKREVNSVEGVRTLTLSAVTQNDFSISNTKITEADPDRAEDLWLRRGDILIERGNTRELVGLAALYDGDERFAIFPDLMIRARVDRARVVPKYAVEFLLSPPVRRYFQMNAQGTAGSMPKIGHLIVKQLPFALPPLEEQERIAFALASVDRKINAEQSRRASLEAVFRSLLINLMTGRRRIVLQEVA